MSSPDFANPIRPEEFPHVYRDMVREIGGLVLQQTPAVIELQQRLLEASDNDLITAQRHGRFSRADVANRIAREFAPLKDGQRAE